MLTMLLQVLECHEAERDKALTREAANARAGKDKELKEKDKELKEELREKDKELADTRVAKEKELADTRAEKEKLPISAHMAHTELVACKKDLEKLMQQLQFEEQNTRRARESAVRWRADYWQASWL